MKLGQAKQLLISERENMRSACQSIAQKQLRIEMLTSLLQQMLDVAENADETGYVTDVGFVDLGELHQKVRTAIAKCPPPPAALPVNEDTARIEWLEKRHEFHADRGYEHGEPVTLQLVEGNINDRQYRTVGEGDTLRAAIDAARKATP